MTHPRQMAYHVVSDIIRRYPPRSADAHNQIAENNRVWLAVEQALDAMGVAGGHLGSDARERGRIGTDSGHGHAWKRPDGRVVECGGPRFARGAPRTSTSSIPHVRMAGGGTDAPRSPRLPVHL